MMYIPPRQCVRKPRLRAEGQSRAGATAPSPGDFPREDYEASWEGRFTLDDLNIHGKRALGMAN